MKYLELAGRDSVLSGTRFHLAWHQSHIPGILRGEEVTYVLIPEGTSERLQHFSVDVISGTGRPVHPQLTVNQLQIASLRDPGLTVDSSEPLRCLKEFGLIQRLLARARAAAYILPEIVPTDAPPKWSRYILLTHQREILWRARGSG